MCYLLSTLYVYSTYLSVFVPKGPNPFTGGGLVLAKNIRMNEYKWERLSTVLYFFCVCLCIYTVVFVDTNSIYGCNLYS